MYFYSLNSNIFARTFFLYFQPRVHYPTFLLHCLSFYFFFVLQSYKKSYNFSSALVNIFLLDYKKRLPVMCLRKANKKKSLNSRDIISRCDDCIPLSEDAKKKNWFRYIFESQRRKVNDSRCTLPSRTCIVDGNFSNGLCTTLISSLP